MENKEINLKINSNIDDVTKEIKSLNKNLDNTTDVVKDVGKSTKEVEKNTKTLADGFKGVGLAIKAMGIGLVISAMDTLKEVFMSNQKVADAVATGFGTVVNVFTKVVDVVVSVVEKVNKSSDGFKGLTAVISGLITISLTPLKLGFYAISLAIDEARLAWEESFFGDEDPKTIKELNKRISATKDNIVKVGKDAVDAGKKVATNIGDAITEVGAVVEGTIDGVSKISVSAAYEQAKANTQLQNNAKLAEANQARLVEQYDRQAEKLRQIRDEERNSITDRIKANDDLKIVLDKQQKAMLGAADAQVAAAQATLAQNKSIENQVALTNALANKEGVLAQIEGLRSEQKANDLSLNKELLELTKSKQEAETQLAIDQKQFDAERLKDEEAVLLAQKEALEFAKTKELERLQNVIKTTKEGTQARVDAENEYAAKKQEIENQITTKQDEIDTYRINRKAERLQEIYNSDVESFSVRLTALQQYNAMVQQSDLYTEEEKRKIQKETLEQEKSLINQRLSLTAQTAGNIANILGKNSKAGKAFAVSQALINTYQGITAELATKTATPFEFGIKLANIATTAAIGFKTVQDILKTNPSSSSSPASSSATGASGGAAPQFNVVGNSGVNQLAETMQGRSAQAPIQAYVVAQNVTTAQSLNRNIVSNASLG